jgi:phenylalanyl-tRNA synthetase beta chain
MKISTRWLRTYVDHDWSAEELADRLTLCGLEVESVEAVGPTLDGVVVGRVLGVRAHPEADRLTLCDVDTGNGEAVQIVCGAPNVAAGQVVPVATVGTTLRLPDRDNPGARTPVTLRKAKIRGKVSHGMICAEDELGLSDDHSGIMVLEDHGRPGESFASYLERAGYPATDTVLDVAVTPNRPDATSHLGVARDVAALADRPLRRPDVALPREGGEAARAFSVDIEAPGGCHRYVGLLVRGVTIAESPAWLRQRLAAIGLRPRNNVVDITNFVMHECGQPLHAFDFDQLAGHHIVVRRTAAEGPFTTLDGKVRTLPKGTLMIADGERDVAVAGVMGGENSEVTQATTDVLIESAYFDPSDIRRTAKALQLPSDASYRFERGVDPDGQVWAAARAAALMVQVAGGTLAGGMVDAHPVKAERRALHVRSARIASVLGVDVPAADAERLLRAIGFEPRRTDDGMSVTVPTWRPDVEREIDVIEEIARLHGLDRIPEPTHSRLPNVLPTSPVEQPVRDRTARILSGAGFREIYTNSMLPPAVATLFAHPVLRGGDAVGEAVQTLNPISTEMAALRPSLLPGMLQVLAHNLNHGQAGLRMFEIGVVMDRFDAPGAPVAGYRERTSLLVAVTGRISEPGWDTKGRSADVFDLRGHVEALFEGLGVSGYTLDPVREATPLTRYHLAVRLGDRPIGCLGAVGRDVLDRFDLRGDVFFAELDLGAVANGLAGRGWTRYRDVTRFPVVDRDIAVVVDAGVAVGPLLDAIREAGRPLLRRTGVFDLYHDERLGPGRKSVAFSMRFASDRTLRDAEADEVVERIVRALGERYGAVLRA